MSTLHALARATLAACALLALGGCGIAITQPTDGSVVAAGDVVTFTAVRKLGASSAHAFKWTSSLDGVLGTGDVLRVPDAAAGRPPLRAGAHTIQAQHPGPFMWSWWSWRDRILLTVMPLSCPPADFDLTATSAGGSPMLGQSYNEIRAVDVTVLGSTPRIVEQMTLKGLNLGAATSTRVGARIYDATSQAQLASSDTTVAGPGAGVTVTIPIAATLAAGQRYRIGVFVETTPPWQGSATVFIPASFPYTENAGVLRVNSGHGFAGDQFPAHPSTAVPQLTLRMRCP